MKQEPLVSVLMNCYNGEKYLREAIDSIRAQTYQNWEIIFWDNQSTDGSAEIFKSYNDPRFKYFHAPVHTDLGGGRARAWKYLTGDFIAVLDTDDVWLPRKLEKQIPFFSDPDIGLVISDTLFFNDKVEKPLYGGKYPPVGFVFEQLLAAYSVSLETVVFRRATALRLKRGFDPDFSFIADFDIVVRLSRISKLALYPGILAKWRVHAASDSWKYPLAFVEEKKRWLAKQIAEEPGFARKYSKAIGRFKSKNIRTEVAHALINHRRLCAFKLLMKSKFDHWHAWALLLICLIPFSDSIISYLYKRKAELA
ncbi:MAG TPA: glycosyltransferase family 2 protein [Opitutaceae bacterium]|nr:glycosyltransferase family 2 protein [Opitutaceae bacterium]